MVYKIQTQGGKTNYAGIAQRGRVQNRIAEHLAGARDTVPGARVQIEQISSIRDARAKECKLVAKSRPKYNKEGL